MLSLLSHSLALSLSRSLLCLSLPFPALFPPAPFPLLSYLLHVMIGTSGSSGHQAIHRCVFISFFCFIRSFMYFYIVVKCVWKMNRTRIRRGHFDVDFDFLLAVFLSFLLLCVLILSVQDTRAPLRFIKFYGLASLSWCVCVCVFMCDDVFLVFSHFLGFFSLSLLLALLLL